MGVASGAPHPPSGETPWVQRVEFCAQYLLAVNRNAELSLCASSMGGGEGAVVSKTRTA